VSSRGEILVTSRIRLSRIAVQSPGRGLRLARELAARGGARDHHKREVNVVADAGEGLAQADRCPADEAGREVEHPAFPGGARETAFMQGVDGGSPVDFHRAGTSVVGAAAERAIRARVRSIT